LYDGVEYVTIWWITILIYKKNIWATF
jgi:hypothetical protein